MFKVETKGLQEQLRELAALENWPCRMRPLRR